MKHLSKLLVALLFAVPATINAHGYYGYRPGYPVRHKVVVHHRIPAYQVPPNGFGPGFAAGSALAAFLWAAGHPAYRMVPIDAYGRPLDPYGYPYPPHYPIWAYYR